ncbi:hypothetical protein PF005_g23318 [Phytophthora fragariae]|uniref:Uncharacterized protein n=1 Tax=Phytophthora fragariae TaxID=53985 RepID=A0A6A3S0Q2_9STRA|nr:hypothetical protein PF003_g33315 [Phytophthora fragariae]KAE8925739.1 hypothetical protein PF009_g24055 [Phytophthora fragariae]KAE8980946.1 hypothetical protein PF011_g22222 [Phytophthora fragariae]KAE9079627.1 hypothetical protein PF010_g22684 [Phytophthora fragariae]KAE9107664.1 hypothetical protein PF007_g12953 [Phytophthora fragariae]
MEVVAEHERIPDVCPSHLPPEPGAPTLRDVQGRPSYAQLAIAAFNLSLESVQPNETTEDLSTYEVLRLLPADALTTVRFDVATASAPTYAQLADA